MVKIIILCVLIPVCLTQKREEDAKPRWFFDTLEFEKFKIKFNKSYSTMEDEKRYKIFEHNLRDIEHHNKKYEKGTVTWLMGIGPFADLTEKEFMDKFKLDTRLEEGGRPPLCENINYDNFPNTVSHVQHLGKAKNQQDCNAGWAFAVVATAEAMLSKRNIKVSLSEQNLIDCAYGFEYGSYGCSGGIPWSGLNYMAFKGITSSKKYRFENKNSNCRRVCCDLYYASNICRVVTTENSLKSALNKVPLVMDIEVTPALMHYRRGIIKDDRNCLRRTNHAVSVIGYGKGYWTFRNSWGPFWGEDGNYRLTSDKRYQCTFGKNAFSLKVHKEEGSFRKPQH